MKGIARIYDDVSDVMRKLRQLARLRAEAGDAREEVPIMEQSPSAIRQKGAFAAVGG
ncbi:hypothetical protein [Amycolatopsis silviterrae]|uniref:Uncharacterized protein n=1 Tax=Amycolatopsis silviterrae TaxID=1656914 RepID=A0ABW5H8B4_9PSEU